MNGKKRLNVGTLVVLKRTTFRKLYECAAWYTDIQIEPGEYVLDGIMDSRNDSLKSVNCVLKGTNVGSDFSSLFGGNRIKGGEKVDEDIGNSEEYIWSQAGYSLAENILHNNGKGKCEYGYIILNKKFVAQKEYFTYSGLRRNSWGIIEQENRPIGSVTRRDYTRMDRSKYSMWYVQLSETENERFESEENANTIAREILNKQLREDKIKIKLEEDTLIYCIGKGCRFKGLIIDCDHKEDFFQDDISAHYCPKCGSDIRVYIEKTTQNITQLLKKATGSQITITRKHGLVYYELTGGYMLQDEGKPRAGFSVSHKDYATANQLFWEEWKKRHPEHYLTSETSI